MTQSVDNSTRAMEALCGYTEECPFARFTYVTICGMISMFGIVSNLLLFHVFFFKRSPNSPSNFYPAILALLDCLLCIAYILLFVVDVNMVYLQNEELFSVYHAYIIQVLSFSRMNQLAIPYLLILATLERFAWVAQRFRETLAFRPKGRQVTVLLTLLLCVLIRIPALFTLYVEKFRRCPDPMRRLAVAPTKFAMHPLMYYYDTYFIVMLQTVIPFIVLISLNLIIIKKMCTHDSTTKSAIIEVTSSMEDAQLRTNSRRRSMGRVLSTLKIHKMPTVVRNAVYTMVTIVCTYLISNSLHIFLMLLEKTNASILYINNDIYSASPFYTIMGDMVSISYMLSSAIRIVVYAVCNPVLRRHLAEIILNEGASGNLDDVKNTDQQSLSISSREILEENTDQLIKPILNLI